MLIRRVRVVPLFGAFVGALMPLIVLAVAQPTPPPSICVGTRCASTPMPAPAQAISTSGGIKWHPGHYVWLDPNASQAAQFAVLDALSGETTVRGIQLQLYWAALEGPTPGDYSNGFATVDAFLAKLASLAVPKRLILEVNERSFGSPAPAGTSCAVAARSVLPAYLESYGGGGCVVAPPGAAGDLAVMASSWDPAVMDRLIALSQAYAQRYDQNPLFEMFAGDGETAVGVPSTSTYTPAVYSTQLERWFDASEKAWAHTQLRLQANYDGSNTQMLNLMSYASANGRVIIGGPDPELPLPDITRTIQASELFRDAGGNGRDFRSAVPWIGEVQSMGLGLRYTQTPAGIYDYEANTMHASYMVWMDNTWLGGSAQRWSTGILPFIRSINGAVYSTACPASYHQGCNTN